MTSKKFPQLCSLWLIVGLVLSLFSCGAVYAANEPEINHFYATPASVNSGETVTLDWQTTNVARVEIIGIEHVPEEGLATTGTTEIWPLTTTSYVLIAYGNNGMVVSKAFTVNVGVTGTVKIDFFKSTKILVTPGETVSLSWRIYNGKSARIIGIEHEDECLRPLEGEVEVWPLKTTTYILEATGFNGEVQSASITVNVKENTTNPEILSFISNKYNISKGEMITLSWTTNNTITCKITTSSGQTLPNRPPNGSISLTPNKTTTFTLIALDASGNETKQSLTITVTTK